MSTTTDRGYWLMVGPNGWWVTEVGYTTEEAHRFRSVPACAFLTRRQAIRFAGRVMGEGTRYV